MESSERPEWKQPELKDSGPQLVESEAPSKSELAFSDARGDGLDLAEVIAPESSTEQVFHKSNLSALTTYMLKNESQFYWLCASTLLTVLAIWFHDIHGFLIWSSFKFNFYAYFVSLLAPFCGIFLLLNKSHRFERPLLSISAFVFMLFWNMLPAITCLILMPFRFSGFDRGIGRAMGVTMLLGLQTTAILLFPFTDDTGRVESRLYSENYDLYLRRTNPVLDHRIEIIVAEEYPVGPLLNFAKVHWRMFDTRSPKSAVLLPIDATHVAVLVNRFSSYHRSVIDLSVKNLPIRVETMPAEK